MIESDGRRVLVELFNRVNNNSNCTFPTHAGDISLEPYDIVDEHIEFAFLGVGILLLALVGIPANLLSVKVWTHPKLKSSLAILLVGLTISDIIVLATSFLYLGLHLVLNKTRVLPSYYSHIRPHLYPWYLPIFHTAQMSSIYCTILITLERFIAVCHPLKARSLCTRAIAFRAVIVVVCLSVLYNIPRWFELETFPVTNCDNLVIWYVHRDRQTRRNVNYAKYYQYWGYAIVIFVVPFVTIACLNFIIHRTANRRKLRQSSLSSARTACETKEKEQLIGMLFGIVITFLICYMLLFVGSVMTSLGSRIPKYIFSLYYFLGILSHSSNFVFYCAFGSRFRQQLKELFRISQTRDTMNNPKNDITFPAAVFSASPVAPSSALPSEAVPQTRELEETKI